MRDAAKWPRGRRPLAALCLVAAAVGAAACAGPRAGAPPLTVADLALTELAGGPQGSRPVALTAWRYRADPTDAGLRLGWAHEGVTGRPVTVPGVANGGAIAGAAGRRAYAGTVGWYSRPLDVPRSGRYELGFESANHRATVFVDGRRVKEHVGAYEPFGVRLTLAAGTHDVVVRVDWRDPAGQARADFDRGWFNWGGLNRPVTLIRLARTELGEPFVRTILGGDGQARVLVSVRVRNDAPVARRIRPHGSLTRGAGATALRFTSVQVPAGRAAIARASAELDRPALWSPSRPALYRLRVDVGRDASLRLPVGLRELRWDSGRLLLNGRPLVLHGAALPPGVRGAGDAFSAADEDRLVAELRQTGANATRAQMPLAESLLERLDAAGILVWQEVGPWEPAGAWRADSPTQIDAARDRALRTVRAQQWHPSILAWTLTNEASGRGRPAQTAYVTRTARAVHAIDPSRPVAADLWGRRLTRVAAPLMLAVDALGVTDYVGWYEDQTAAPSVQDAVASERVRRLRALFPGKPVVVTELGAGGSARVPSRRFGGEGFQADLLGRRIRGLAAVPGLSGILVWSLIDYPLRPQFRGGSALALDPGLDLAPGLNEKGLFDYDGRPKPALRAVRRAFAAR